VFRHKLLFYGLFVSLATMIAISGCALRGSKVAKLNAIQPQPTVSMRGWWYARFGTHWPENTDPPWHLDVMIAHKIVLPVLNQYKDDIGLWRFHRRAARDIGGHLFSFIFYSTPDTAQNVYVAFESDLLLKQLKEAGIITRFISNNTDQVIRPDIEDTSDKSWSTPIQKTWPYYIMGVSQMWLHLISEIAEHNASRQAPSSLIEYQDFYRQVNESVQASWQEEGRHAFLHHLNAIFGYEPVIGREKQLMKF
jgi:hypothetical protein